VTRAEVQILEAQSGALSDAQAGTVEKPCHEERRILQAFECAANLVVREHDGQARGPRGAFEIVKPGRIDA
jgi:hypothetical protein